MGLGRMRFPDVAVAIGTRGVEVAQHGGADRPGCRDVGQEILDREEKVTLVPFLIMQGGLDDNVLPEVQEKFAKAYKAAGGDCDYRLFENSVHEWVAEPGPQTDKAVEVAKEFIARQLKA